MGHRVVIGLAISAIAALGAGVTPSGAMPASPSPSAPPAAAPAAAPNTRPITPSTHLPAGVMPKNHVRQAAFPSGAHLTYYGGHVIPNVRVIQVLYGAGTYTPEVSDPSTADGTSIASFYTGATNSTYFDWLSEYNTNITANNGQPGTNQSIGRGTFAQQVQITPAASNNGSTVDDVNIQSDLRAQISAGHLPAPTANTLYAVYFRAGQTITQGGSSSGVAFCAYHGTVAAGSTPEFYYSVLPDFTTGGMTSGCGNGTRFQNETSVSSHEMIEAVTDAEVGLATSNAPPLAWYDNANGEIGDICNGQQQAITGGDAHTYTVQQEFSNLQNSCVVNGPATTDDFSLSLSPTSRTVVAGSSTTATVSTVVTAGSPAPVSLSASSLPNGAGASFSPTSVTAGGSSTLTVTTATNTPAGTYSVTVTGTEGSKAHGSTLMLTVSPPTTTTTGPATTTTTVPSTTTTVPVGSQLLGNPGFETGSAAPWSATTGVVSNSSAEPPHGGSWDAWLDGYGTAHTDTLSQSVTIPASAASATLSFWLHIDTAETTTTTVYDRLSLQVLNSSGAVLATVHSWSNLNAGTGYALQSFDFSAYKGQNITVKFTGNEDSTLQTSFVIDDTALTTH